MKSRTARASLLAAARDHVGERTAYVLSIGVDDFDDPRWDLTYAAADARLFATTLATSLRETGDWARVRSLVLVSTRERDAAGHPATADRARKRDVEAALTVLAGGEVDDRDLARIPEWRSVGPARPGDLVIVAVSTHGQAAKDGAFYLLPSDVVTAENGAPVPASCISASDLEAWLRPVDAESLALVVDACQSSASVEGEGFKPGPMSSRGFGQLAWNKKMMVLTASQASEYALESRALRHGLLTHALLREGIEDGRADAEPEADGVVTLREALTYAADRVPTLAEDVAAGLVEAAGPRGPHRRSEPPPVTRLTQRPALFDFTPAEEDTVVLRRLPSSREGR